MDGTGVGNYRNGTYGRSSVTSSKVDKSYSGNSIAKNSVKQKSSLPGSAVRKGAPGSLATAKDGSGVSGRVRVTVRLRPRNTEEMVADADFADCVELQPELKRLKLKRNNWDSDTYEFDEVFTEFASQKRVYEVVAKPVVESVLDGYNGTVMAYGQTGTGKTYTLGYIGEEDIAARGIMVRAMEDILANVSLETDSIRVSYLQQYMETIQDLLDPNNDNISILEDPKVGDISLPGARLIEIRNQDGFLELLHLGDVHRFAANTRLNTESSRSHAILMVHVWRSVTGNETSCSSENNNNNNNSVSVVKSLKPSVVRKGKLTIVDLAGSERIDKSGSEGHTLEEAKSINLSLSALGKCINALAEHSSHIPVRDTKLTRLLRDSFGGTARTSMIITIGPSPRHRAETTSTIMFGQRAMKVENMLKLKEEFDYKSLSWMLDRQLEKLIVEHERKQKACEDELIRITIEAENQIREAERKYADALEDERLKYQKECLESIKKIEQKWMINQQMDDIGRNIFLLKDDIMFNGEGFGISAADEVAEMKSMLQKETLLRKAANEEVYNLKNQLAQSRRSEEAGISEILKLHKMLDDEALKKENFVQEIAVLQSQLLHLSFEADETRRRLDISGPEKAGGGLGSLASSHLLEPHVEHSGNRDKSSMATLFEQVGLQKILTFLESEDADLKIHAVKVVANLAAEEANQKKIVEAGGLNSLLMLLESSQDETIHRVASGAIANLAMNETNQELIIAQGGIVLLSSTAKNAEDPETLRMVAGAIANLCGNDKLQMKLQGDGGLKALVGMVKCMHPDVLAQIARGVANFAKCESRASADGGKMRKSLLIEDGLLQWIVKNSKNEVSQIKRHLELALCHLAQHEVNAKDMVSSGALWELVRISRDCTREEIRTLALKTLTSSLAFQNELRKLRIYF